MFRLKVMAARAAVAILAAILVPSVGFAQMTRGSIAGVVRDASGAVVPGATVTVTNVATNAALTAVTDGEGFYRVPALEPGVYTVNSELSGFRKVETRDVAVRTAQETPLDFKMDPAGIGETVQVTAEAATAGLNRTNPTIATSISARAIEDLPLPGGRNINNLILTVPNAQSTSGQGTYAVNGNRPRNNNYMIDGSDNNDISVTIATSQVVPEAVAEFQVMQNPYSVEFGRNSGGQINVITKSGSNRFAGDFFDYYQASGMNSRSNIDKENGLSDPARLIRHQLGGDIGGPILKDKVFFFGLFQRDTQNPAAQRPFGTAVRIPTPAGLAAVASVPLRAGQSAASRQAMLSSMSYLTDILAQNPVFRNVNSSTLANGVAIETGQTNVGIFDPSKYLTYMGRGDFRPAASDNITVRYHFNDRSDVNAVSNCTFGALYCGDQLLADTNFAASDAHIFSSSLLNEARFSIVRRDLQFPENDPTSPTVFITGLFNIGGANNFPQGRVTTAYQFSNTTTYNVGRHAMKFGADIRLNDVLNEAAFDSKGTFTFNNLQDYLNNNAFAVTQAFQAATFEVDQWQNYFFVQDDFRVTSDLTLNLGLRYETSDVPLGMFGATDPRVLDAGVPGPVKRDTNNWAPRVGFAWSPRSQNRLIGDGKTVVRGGFGIAYDVLFYNLLTVNTNPVVNTLTVNNLVDQYPNKLPSRDTFGPLNAYTNSAENTENPESRFYSLTVQREFGKYLLEVGYSGSRGYKGINQVHVNPAILTAEQAATVRAGGTIPSVQSRRVNPAWGVRTLIPAYVGPGGNDVEARSEYNAIFVSANRRLSDGLMVNTSYTFSKWMSNNDASLGEGGTPQSSQRPQNMFDYEAEWTRSNFDRPHRLAVSYIWEVPGPKSGILGQIAGGWQLSGVTSGQSGAIFTVFTGVDSNGDANTGSDRPNINTSGTFTWDDEHRGFTNNGYYTVPLGSNNAPLANSLGDGNAPRNSERARHFWNTDLALMKRFDLPSTVTFTVRVDMFNALNQDNYGAPNATMSSASFGQNTNNWGRRVMQLGGKITF
jgi:hypothetical protein